MNGVGKGLSRRGRCERGEKLSFTSSLKATMDALNDRDPDDFLADLVCAEKVKERINDGCNALFESSTDKLRAFVCTICDEFIVESKRLHYLPLTKLHACQDKFSWDTVDDEGIDDLRSYYCFPIEQFELEKEEWLRPLALSPRGSYVLMKGKNKRGFTCCEDCYDMLNVPKSKVEVPLNAIVNRNFVGCAPECLKELTEVELNFISPVQSYAYCHVWTGGSMKAMRGTMVFMRTRERKVAKAVATLECMGLNKHVVVLLSGKMTSDQKKRVETKAKLRTDKLIAAMEWLCKNNRLFKDVDMEVLRQQIGECKPIMVDRSVSEASQNANVEQEEIFSCYYPDGASNPTSGGFDTPGAFKEFVKEMQEQGFDIEMKARLEREFVRGGDDEILLGGCLLQFPYGLGGIEELRQLPKGKLQSKAPLEAFVKHLSKKSDRVFQTPLFQLILYSLKCKARLLALSRLQLKTKVDAKNIAEGFSGQDFSEACRGRRNGEYNRGSKVSKKVLDAVDAVAKALPHTADCAKKGRTCIESMMHYLGNGSLFLTATPDDENSILIQVLSDVRIDGDERAEDLTDDDLASRAKQREQIRFEYPGIAAMNFDAMLDVLFEEAICWDRDNKCPNGKKGLFGEVEGVAYAVEEQGRKTLHCHIILWIKGYSYLKRQMFFGDVHTQAQAKTTMARYCDRIAGTKFFPNKVQEIKKAFAHECEVEVGERKIPETVPLQNLRWMRHKKGCKDAGGVFATCPDCDKKWTYEELVSDYCMQGQGIRDKVSDIPEDLEDNCPPLVCRARLLGNIIDYQKPDLDDEDCPQVVTSINAVRNSHASCHAKSCFKCNKLQGRKKTAHVCNSNCECRYRLPDLSRQYTTVKTHEESVPWFGWNGTEKQQPLLQVHPKRNQYDLFQNVCCPVISHSKFGCNTNISCIMDGPIAYYISKYAFKETDKDETQDYAEVEKIMKKMAEGRVHQDDRAEALRIICRAVFAHNRVNIVSGAMAAFLNRNDSRFYFSHDFAFCPLTDVTRIHNHQDITGQFNANGSFFENEALHYLCRPQDGIFESVSLREFTETYQTVYMSKKRKRDGSSEVTPYAADTGHFKHPSAAKKKNGTLGPCKQGVKERSEPILAKIPQWAFCDTADFHGDIFTVPAEKVNEAMNNYAQRVLTLLVPHRCAADLQEECPSGFKYAEKLRTLWFDDQLKVSVGEEPTIFTKCNIRFLQNIQDSARNSIRFKIKEDELQSLTDPYIPAGVDLGQLEDEEDEDPVEDASYEEFLSMLGRQFNPPPSDNDPEYFIPTMNHLNFKNIRAKGDKACGFSGDFKASVSSLPAESFVRWEGLNSNSTTGSAPVQEKPEQRTYGVKKIVEILLRRTSVSSKNVWKDKDIEVSDANGSVASIREWSLKGFGNDKKQQRAFEAIIASFLLTFYEDDNTTTESTVDPTVTSSDRCKYRSTKKNLLKLKGALTPKDLQLIALLHGPGGSGKSTVINMVVAYAKSYCDLLGHPFTKRTIVITAMSGVAATLLKGETTHLALGMNKETIPEDMKTEWEDARLVIIDEISFAAISDIERINKCLSTLMSARYKLYGGINVVFAGDYSQLEPVKKTDKVYLETDTYVFHKAVNAFIELDGTHRFRDDPVYGQRMFRFRQGKPTLEDVQTLNAKCHVSVKPPPPGIQVATYYNKNRDAVNTAVFEEWCRDHRPSDPSAKLEHACVIFMDCLHMKNSKDSFVPITSNQVKRYFFENVSENDCVRPANSKGRVDPILKLYPNCPVMFTENNDVSGGQANGSRLLVQYCKLKTGERPATLMLDCGTKVNAVTVSQVDHILVKHENGDISPSTFEVKPHSFTFTAKLHLGVEEHVVKMKGQQFTIISNSCTTGHKLQGCTLIEMLVNDFRYTVNWPYVVLSRVKTMNGLYLREKLSEDLKKYAMDPLMKQMLNDFRERSALATFSDQEYAQMMRINQ